ncbi:PLDc N-terminal domain-containing protein [Belliella aquatica]|uniref:PLDc N-terminal domain-containing protein n=1 Tax=Belliella aquatica TaxID=1323734 RepID=UPI001669CC72|nr:PLDc N-terminal domain-containing protein [Belliella aquatica]MCH7406010.1 PLDc N-terminal domain-containing protein [Belliella aquatica]
MNLSFIGGISPGSFILILFSIVAFAFFVFWIITLVDIVRSNFKDPNMKLIWILIVLFANFLGVIIYWIIAPNQKNNNFNQFNHFK